MHFQKMLTKHAIRCFSGSKPIYISPSCCIFSTASFGLMFKQNNSFHCSGSFSSSQAKETSCVAETTLCATTPNLLCIFFSAPLSDYTEPLASHVTCPAFLASRPLHIYCFYSCECLFLFSPYSLSTLFYINSFPMFGLNVDTICLVVPTLCPKHTL